MPVWIKLLKLQHLEINGKMETKHPGDWIEVGNATANFWINSGIATKPNLDKFIQQFIDPTAGLVAYNFDLATVENLVKDLNAINYQLALEPDLRFSENLIWNGKVKLQKDFLPMGFNLLKHWDLAVPLMGYEPKHLISSLALEFCNQDQIDYLKSVLKDLRVPAYNTGLIFARRNDLTLELFKQWLIEREMVSHPSLSFHLAYYKVKPVLNALPAHWIRG